jgi:thioredoxin reductase
MFDVLVVGGGPAGLSAAMMLGRCRRRVLVCDLGQPRNRKSHALHGYMTRDGIPPAEFNDLGRRELTAYGVELRKVGVTGARKLEDHYRVALADGTEEQARFLLIATGVVDDLPAVPGFADCYGRSIFHCPYCDGWEVGDRRIAAFGNGRDVAGLALGLKTWSADVVVCTNGGRIERRQRERLPPTGSRSATSRSPGSSTRTACSRASFRVGRSAAARCDVLHHRPASAVGSRDCAGVHADVAGAVRTGATCDTNVPRLFVAGDASRDAQFVVVAAAEGVKAACAINKAMQLEELKP